MAGILLNALTHESGAGSDAIMLIGGRYPELTT
jgi:hypothetical protein